jgi:hypothetical protein
MNAPTVVLSSLGLLAALLTTSCAHEPVDPAAIKKCWGSPCKLKVIVTSCTDIKVEPPALETDHAVNLRWRIDSDDYEFATNGIEFTDSQFEKRDSRSKREFHMRDKKTSTGDFHYKVNIEGCAPVDPYIKNT